MERNLEAAVLDIQDAKLVIVFLDHAASEAEYATLERAAVAAGLEGEIAAVWPDEFGCTRFLARSPRHAFLRAAGYDQLRAQVNATLRCSLG